MKYLLIILLFISCTATSQTASSTVMDTPNLRTNTGFINVREALQFIYNKLPPYALSTSGTVTQATSKATAVTLNNMKGRITMNGAALAAGAEVSFSLNNTFISATDVVIVNIQSVGTVNSYLVSVGAVANGSCSITISNASPGSLSQAIVLNFLIIK